jgi:DNA-binding MarR family transcriptional regulator
MKRGVLFDSVNFVVLDVRAQLLERNLKDYDLNLTRYCILLKCQESNTDAVTLRTLSSLFRVQPSAITQATNNLETRGLIQRVSSSKDARMKMVVLTAQGTCFLEPVHTTLFNMMRLLFNPTLDWNKETFLQRGLRIGGQVGDIWSSAFIERYPVSANLTAVSLFRKSVENALFEKTGLPLTECRILQRLAEVGEPQRAIDLAAHMRIQPPTLAKAKLKLQERGYICCLKSPYDKKAVYLELTNKGTAVQKVILTELDRVGREQYWGCLSQEDLETTRKIRELFLDDIARQEREHQRRVLDSLRSV